MIEDEFNSRTVANMAVALDRVCRKLADGEDHATRVRVAEAILDAARAGHCSLGDLEASARKALIRPVNRSDQAT